MDTKQQSKMVALVQQWGLAKTQKEAETLLIALSIVALILAGGIWWFSTPHGLMAPVSREMQLQMFKQANPGVTPPADFLK